jgi:hypothetical protein
MKRTLLMLMICACSVHLSEAQAQVGVFKTMEGNTDYHHFTRDGGGAAVYINQVSTGYPILRLCSGTPNPNQGVKLTVENNGNVGIGTSTPVANLDVAGDGINTRRLSLAGKINDRTNDSPWYGLGLSSFKTLCYEGTRRSVQLAGYYGLLIRTNKGILAIHQNGNVGIGNSDPKTTLDVTGTIRATEIKVEAQTADFVFEEEYQLRPLKEVEQFVMENKHLPEIPSAKEMKKEGVNVAEMNKLLLQKVEELTLYTIEQEKKLKKRDDEVEKLKKRMAKLEALVLNP